MRRTLWLYTHINNQNHNHTNKTIDILRCVVTFKDYQQKERRRKERDVLVSYEKHS